MTTFLLNSFPNSLIPDVGDVTITAITASDVITLIAEVDYYRDWDGAQPPYILRRDVISCVGHESTAAMYATALGKEVGAVDAYGNLLVVDGINTSRQQANPQPGDIVVAGLFTSPRRLPEGQLWSEDEIISMPIKWIKATF